MRKSLLAIGASLNAVAATILGVYQVKEAILRHAARMDSSINSALQFVFEFSLPLSVALIFLSLPFFAFWLYLFVINSVYQPPANELASRPCTSTDLKAIYQLATLEFGQLSSTLKNIQRLFEFCPQAFWVVGYKRVVGYFILYSLTDDGEKAITEGYFSGSNPTPQHIHADLSKGNAIYVGGIVGRGPRAKGAVLSAATAIVANLRHERIYAKVVSDAGLRLAKRYNMKTVSGGEPVSAKDEYGVLVRPAPTPQTNTQ